MTTTVTNSGFLTGLYVIMVPLFAVILFRQRPHIVIWPGALLALAGIWLLSGGEAHRAHERRLAYRVVRGLLGSAADLHRKIRQPYRTPRHDGRHPVCGLRPARPADRGFPLRLRLERRPDCSSGNPLHRDLFWRRRFHAPGNRPTLYDGAPGRDLPGVRVRFRGTFRHLAIGRAAPATVSSAAP